VVFPVPLGLSLAALVGSAYATAKLSLEADLVWLSVITWSMTSLRLRERNGRLNFFHVVESHALNPATAQLPCILFEDERYTYAEVYELAMRYGTWLRTRRGVRPKHVVPMDFRNGATFIFLWFGLWSIGAKPSFINHNLSGKPLAHCLKAVSSPLALVDPGVVDSFTDEVRQELDGMELLVFTPELQAEIRRTEPVRATDEDLFEDKAHGMAMLIYTSGTTGLPKPAVVSWSKVWVGGYMSSVGTSTRAGDVCYTVSHGIILAKPS
jgi:acyl-coenzyme A synthetase/AMP-(fatty) acid ligase